MDYKVGNKYRWLIEFEGKLLSSQFYLTKYEAIDYFNLGDSKNKFIARLDCLDDLKDKEYYTEDF